MPIGRTWAPETVVVHDQTSGVKVTQHTRHLGHSHHLYFTNNGWYDDGRRLLFASDRLNQRDLFSLDLRSGEITQITDLATPNTPGGTYALSTSCNPRRPEAYLWHGRTLIRVDLQSLETRPLYQAPSGFLPTPTSCSADGAYVYTSLYEDFSHRFAVDIDSGYIGFKETAEQRPHSMILQVHTRNGVADIMHEERMWIGHVSASPVHSNLLTFCHEGPWKETGQRIWGLDTTTRSVWRIRPQAPDDAIGHEYWFADGETIGYHGQNKFGPLFGAIRYDNTERIEERFPYRPQHYHCNNLDFIVEDGRQADPPLPYVLVWRYHNHTFEGPRILCEHRSVTNIQQAHVHPRVAPDGRSVLFTSNRSGYCNVYSVEFPGFLQLASLPMAGR